MRQGPNKRGRGRGGNGPHNPNMGGGGNRRPNGGNGGVPNRNQNYDSNGPDVRIRGSAYQVYEKYMNLAQDAYTAGDRIMAESYYQHAEHYYRIIGAIENGPDGQRRRYDGQNNQGGNGNYQYQQPGQDDGQQDSDDQGDGDERGDMQDGNEQDQPQRQGISHSSYGPGDHEQPE